MISWDEMVENISLAMEAVNEAHASVESLQRGANVAVFQLFLRRTKTLEQHLQRLKTVLDNEEVYAVDELMDALSRVYSDHAAGLRHTPRMGA